MIIVDWRATKMTIRELARKYNLSVRHIYRIIKNRKVYE